MKVARYMADIHLVVAQQILVVTRQQQVHHEATTLLTITAAAPDHQWERGVQVPQLLITITLGNRVQVTAAVLGVIQVTTRVLVLPGTTPIQIVHGIIQAQGVRGAILHLAIPPLVVPAVVADSLAVVDLAVEVVVIAAVADTEDGKNIRSSFYST